MKRTAISASRILMCGLFGFLGLCLIGCGSDGNICRLRNSNQTVMACIVYPLSLDESQGETSCTTPNEDWTGDWSDRACDQNGAVGLCVSPSAGDSYYYPEWFDTVEADDLAERCAEIGGTYYVLPGA